MKAPVQAMRSAIKRTATTKGQLDDIIVQFLEG